MHTKQHLQAARELLSDESRWTKRSYARDVNGHPCSAKSPDACKWCLLGAIQATRVSPFSMAADAVEALIGYQVDVFNDACYRKHTEVLQLIDKAIDEHT